MTTQSPFAARAILWLCCFTPAVFHINWSSGFWTLDMMRLPTLSCVYSNSCFGKPRLAKEVLYVNELCEKPGHIVLILSAHRKLFFSQCSYNNAFKE
jgi:hypothetical protein